MARLFFDWNSVVTLTKSDRSVTGILKGLSEALNCTVFIDGVVDDLLPPAGSYPADALLSTVCKLWKCSWKLEAGTLCITPDFSKENQFPDISLGEIKELASVMTARLTAKYPVFPDNRFKPELIGIVTEVQEQVSPAEKEKLETGSGIRLTRFSTPLQQKIRTMLNTFHLRSAINQWTKLDALLQSFDKARFQSYRQGGGAVQLLNGVSLQLSFGLPNDSPVVDMLHNRLAANRVSLGSYFKEGSLKAPEAIHSHFMLAAPVGDNSGLLKSLAQRNRWECRKGWGDQVLLETKKYRNSDDILELFPEVYRAYLNAGLKKATMLAVTPQHKTVRLLPAFDAEGSLLMGVFQKLLEGRDTLELSTASELEKYVVARLMLCGVIRTTLVETITIERYPESYLIDTPNVVLKHNIQTNSWTLRDSSGASLSFSDPTTTVMSIGYSL